MSTFFLQSHSGFRYLVLLAGFLTVLYSIYGAASKRPYDSKIRLISSTFAGLTHFQLLLGMALIFSGRFQPAVAGHVVMMLFAAASGQIPVSVMRRRPDEEKTYLPHGVWALVSLVAIVAGMMAIGKPLVG
jgi:heme A synthase